jgi:hypothetical protein
MTKISAIDDVTIRRGSDVIKDIVNKIGDADVEKSYKLLEKSGYMDDTKSTNDRYKIWHKNEETMNARNILGGAINRYMYNDKTSKETRKAQLDEYKKRGYDAIVDPEDFVWNYEMPMILLNDSKFKRVADSVVWDKSFKETKQMAKKMKKEGKQYYDFTDEDMKAIDKVKKMAKTNITRRKT